MASARKIPRLGDNDHAPVMNTKPGEGGCWQLWQNIAAQDPDFGHPEKFCTHIDSRPTGNPRPSPRWTTAFRRISRRSASVIRSSGKVVTGGIITVKDSNWLMSYTLNRQPHFKRSAEGSAGRLGLRFVRRCAGQLYQKADARMYRHGNLRRNGCTTWACRRTRSWIWQNIPHAPFHA